MPILPPPPALVRLAGPPTPALRHIHFPSSVFTVDQAVAQVLRETPGAVVVVEDTLPTYLPPQDTKVKFNINGSKIRIILGPPKPGTPSPFGSLFVDSSPVNQPQGGLQARSFPLGWGYN